MIELAVIIVAAIVVVMAALAAAAMLFWLLGKVGVFIVDDWRYMKVTWEWWPSRDGIPWIHQYPGWKFWTIAAVLGYIVGSLAVGYAP